MRPRPSLRIRLLVTLSSTVLLLAGLTSFWSYRDAVHELDELFDAELAQSARLILAQSTTEPPTDAAPLPLPALPSQNSPSAPHAHGPRHHHPYEQKLLIQLWSASRQLLYRSDPSVPETPLTGPDQITHDGFSVGVLEGHRYRIFSLWDEAHTRQVQLGQRLEVRQELAGKIARNLLKPVLWSLPFFAIMIWFGVGIGLRRLHWLTQEVQTRAPEHLEPLPLEPVPSEVLPLVGALNELLTRLKRALTLERQFTADAAHELRTPLAGIRTQAQVAARARDEAERQQALTQVVEGVDRMSHLVQQLLTLARLEPNAPLEGVQPVDVRALLTSVLGELVPSALEQGISLELEDGPALTVSGRPGLLRVLLRNLVDNAVRYTPPGGSVVVEALADAPGHVSIRVRDSGPGIPPSERSRVFDRFYRVLGSEASGSGLGLAIVKRIAELHGADITLEDGLGGHGLGVRVQFRADFSAHHHLTQP